MQHANLNAGLAAFAHIKRPVVPVPASVSVTKPAWLALLELPLSNSRSSKRPTTGTYEAASDDERGDNTAVFVEADAVIDKFCNI
eukprot:scaffold447546_cov15-Prasinocladus_malaysianus.AAC.1